MSRVFPLETAPNCPQCYKPAIWAKTGSANKNGNANRPYYFCNRGHAREFVTWNDARDIDVGNPQCECGCLTRRNKTNANPPRFWWACSSKACSFTTDDVTQSFVRDTVELEQPARVAEAATVFVNPYMPAPRAVAPSPATQPPVPQPKPFVFGSSNGQAALPTTTAFQSSPFSLPAVQPFVYNGPGFASSSSVMNSSQPSLNSSLPSSPPIKTEESPDGKIKTWERLTPSRSVTPQYSTPVKPERSSTSQPPPSITPQSSPPAKMEENPTVSSQGWERDSLSRTITPPASPPVKIEASPDFQASNPQNEHAPSRTESSPTRSHTRRHGRHTPRKPSSAHHRPSYRRQPTIQVYHIVLPNSETIYASNDKSLAEAVVETRKLEAQKTTQGVQTVTVAPAMTEAMTPDGASKQTGESLPLIGDAPPKRSPFRFLCLSC